MAEYQLNINNRCFEIISLYRNEQGLSRKRKTRNLELFNKVFLDVMIHNESHHQRMDNNCEDSSDR